MTREKIDGKTGKEYYKEYNKKYYEEKGKEKYREKMQTLTEEYKCELCAYYTKIKSNFTNHSKTAKHIARSNRTN